MQRRAIYLRSSNPLAAAASVSADRAGTTTRSVVVARLLIQHRLDTRCLLDESTHELGLKLEETQALMKCILGQHNVVIYARRVEQNGGKQLKGLRRTKKK